MRQYAIATLAVFTLSHSAYCADMPLKASQTAPPYNWTGVYAGAHLDYQAGQSRWSESPFGAFGAGGEFALGTGYNFSSGTGSYAIGFQGRYDYTDASHHVFGVEGDVWFPNTVSGNQTFTTVALGSATYSETVQFAGTARICSWQLAALSHGWFRLELRSIWPHARDGGPRCKQCSRWHPGGSVFGPQIRWRGWCGSRFCLE